MIPENVMVERVVDRYATGIYNVLHSKQTKPTLEVCIEHLREFLRDIDAVRYAAEPESAEAIHDQVERSAFEESPGDWYGF